jgi:hypothetical protein
MDNYLIKRRSGVVSGVKKVDWIENGDPKKVRIEDMSDIGKLTHLFWGYNLVDKYGNRFRKYKFMTKFPEEAKRILDFIYPKYHKYDHIAQIKYKENCLNDDVYTLTGFNVAKTADFR